MADDFHVATETRASAPSVDRLLAAPAYRLAVSDVDFALREEMRAMRFAQEYAKAALILKDWDIESTVGIFGSARIRPHEEACARLSAAKVSGDAEDVRMAEMGVEMSRWYDMARDFGRIVATRGGSMNPYGKRRNVVLTGGGPGIMEAGNRGAFEAGAPTIGCNIVLPHEQAPNPYITPELCLRFHYFNMRKFVMVMRASAIAVFPGGFGSLDEAAEVLTLRQTMKSHHIPLVFFGWDEFWSKVWNLDYLAETGMISERDLDLIIKADSAEDGWEKLLAAGLKIGD